MAVCAAGGAEDALGLDVAVRDLQSVEVRQPLQQLCPEPTRFLFGWRAASSGAERVRCEEERTEKERNDCDVRKGKRRNDCEVRRTARASRGTRGWERPRLDPVEEVASVSLFEDNVDMTRRLEYCFVHPDAKLIRYYFEAKSGIKDT